ncbi:hypothetical protein CROQUDRAFT_643701 [Cronartium quercuum f. sp. fusiforme G11]|uniref:Uncharacterized protein n=1 Tax=Cronartium quercuum f. sp. fusiforme G11 TaxID=708437 RepID=A0A9P6NI73_9BASI|nr:hypothetical protein CROQUDRAFT_643701 [Cronartium quercuum f. sp. fusiforme G11]
MPKSTIICRCSKCATHCLSKPDGSVEYGKHVNINTARLHRTADIEHFEKAAKELKNQDGTAVDKDSNDSDSNTELSDVENSEDVQEDSPLIGVSTPAFSFHNRRES